MLKITSKEKDLIIAIADYQILLIEQISFIIGSGKREVQRKINNLHKKDLINFVSRKLRGKRGRSENIISISEKGVNYLQSENLINIKIPFEKLLFDRSFSIEHQLLLNWFRIHLKFIPEKIQDLKVDFISSFDPFLPLKRNGLPLISESLSIENSNMDFIPDGVFYIKSEQQNKSLLFFLEVDMGTESLISRSLKSNNIAKKIINYRIYFQSEKYKRYQKKWKTLFSGFRLLFMTNSTERKNRISNLVNSEKTNDFIWVANQYDMFEKGLGGKIWARGGNLFTSQESILGPTLNFEERRISKNSL